MAMTKKLQKDDILTAIYIWPAVILQGWHWMKLLIGEEDRASVRITKRN